MESTNQPKFEGKIEELALHLSKLVDDLNYHEHAVDKIKERINEIKTQELADLMENEGFAIGSKITLSNGKNVIVKEYFNATIPTETKINKTKDPFIQKQLIEKKEKALKWLNENGVGDIIKNKLTANFNKGEKEKVKEVLLYLQKLDVLCKHDESVHHSTLKATLKEQIGEGKVVPFDTFDIKSGTIVDIK